MEHTELLELAQNHFQKSIGYYLCCNGVDQAFLEEFYSMPHTHRNDAEIILWNMQQMHDTNSIIDLQSTCISLYSDFWKEWPEMGKFINHTVFG